MVVETVVAALQEEAVDRNVSVQTENLKRPLLVNCSSGQLGSVVSNLLRNAIKYVVEENPRKIPTVRIRCFLTAENRARFEIEDNGPGIEEAKQRTIFHLYVRGTETPGGLGLGFADR